MAMIVTLVSSSVIPGYEDLLAAKRRLNSSVSSLLDLVCELLLTVGRWVSFVI